ncbi:hypothetical protein GLYMA_04G000176v4 [Glycine max]|nr:hypothetical protein GLYMA_04G000176v4 [Glycine max]KAH1109064.1 hypothetical protein GYH30_008459 [Glycine max]
MVSNFSSFIFLQLTLTLFHIHRFLVRALSVCFFTGGSMPLRIFCSHILSCFLELIHCLVRNSCLPAKTTWRR